MSNISKHLLPFERSSRFRSKVGPHCTTLGHNSNNTTCIIRDHYLSGTPATSRNQNCLNVGSMYPMLAQEQPSIHPTSLTVSVEQRATDFDFVAFLDVLSHQIKDTRTVLLSLIRGREDHREEEGCRRGWPASLPFAATVVSGISLHLPAELSVTPSQLLHSVTIWSLPVSGRNNQV